MLDAVRPPRHDITGRCRHGQVHRIIRIRFLLQANGANFAHFVGFRLDELLQHLYLRNLGIPVVHHLVKQLVRYHEVVAQGLVLQFLEIAAENISYLVQEGEDHGHVGITLGNADHENVVHLDPNIRDVFLRENWLHQSLILLEYFPLELVCDVSSALTSVVSRYNDLPFLIQKVNGRYTLGRHNDFVLKLIN